MNTLKLYDDDVDGDELIKVQNFVIRIAPIKIKIRLKRKVWLIISAFGNEAILIRDLKGKRGRKMLNKY